MRHNLNVGSIARAASLSLILVGSVSLAAQVVELKGGSSTLYQAQGGTVLVHGPGFNASIGGGSVDGRFFGGGQFVKGSEQSNFILGSDNIPFDLPTDIFETGHYLTGIGAGLRTTTRGNQLYLFMGATSTSFDSPFFEGARAENLAAIAFVSRRVGTQWKVFSKSILSRQLTTIESVSWHNAGGIECAFSGGLGSNHPYAAASLAVTRPTYDLQAAYISASDQFRRADVAVPLSSEPTRENVALTLRPFKFLTVSAGRQNYLTPIYQSTTNIKSSVDQAAINLRVVGVSLAAMVFESTYGPHQNMAMAYMASRSITSKIAAQASYLVSHPQHSKATDSLNATILETLSSRWTASEVVNVSNGQTSFGYGGSFLSNFATISADYQTYYVPSQTSSPFEQALILSAQLHPLSRLTLEGDTFVAPDGRLLYTTAVQSIVSRQMPGSSTNDHQASGDMLIRGFVVDLKGKPVAGAAIMVDQLPVYTDSRGIFYARERRHHVHTLTVLPDQFLEGGLYRVISAPTEIRSGTNDPTQATIVVQRIR